VALGSYKRARNELARDRAEARQLLGFDKPRNRKSASSLSRDVADYYETREEAEATLGQVFRDAPELEDTLWVERVELGALSLN
jgi:hypothetical protein